MRSSSLAIAILSICQLGLLPLEGSESEPPRVHLEIAADNIGTLEGPQQWVRILQGLPLASVRIRTAKPSDQPKIEDTGTPQSPSYRVLGLLTPGNDLLLPGAKVRLGDRAAVERWLGKIAQDADLTDPHAAARSADGDLKKLESAIQQLAPPLKQSTRDRPLLQVIQDVEDQLSLGLLDDALVKGWLMSGPAVQDEYEGVSMGTALSAVLRPAGLALTFDKQATRPALRITHRRDENAWPVGWTSALPSTKTAPKLFEKLEVEMKDTPFQKAVDALQARIQLPLIYDRAAISDKQIRLDEIKVRFPRKRVSYFTVLKNLLFQAHLQMEVRLDEADHPFLWVTPL